MTVQNPAEPSSPVGVAAAASREEALSATSAAKTAFPAWSALSPQERAGQLDAALHVLEGFKDEDAVILSRENGKILMEAAIDLMVFNARFGLASGLADKVETTTVLPGPPADTTVSYKPLGAVTIIVPFNWPLAILAASLPYALVTGNTVVVKPPPSAPLATTRVVQRVAEQLPAGVLNVVTGKDDEIGDALVSSPDIAKVCFTGSPGGGKRIMSMASGSMTRVTLELGGNDPALLLDDADLGEEALDGLFHGIFDSTGQICMAAKRIYVHRSRYQQVVDGLSSRLEQTVLGRGTDERTTMGPLHSAAQKKFVADLVGEARTAGAEVREFGELPGDESLAEGNFLRPSMVLDPDPQLGVVTEEQFGPTIPIIPFDQDDDAIAAANDTWAGLCASVWTKDRGRAAAVGNQLRAGYIFVNNHGAHALDERVPFGGFKGSGMGREMGVEGLREFMDTHSLALPVED